MKNEDWLNTEQGT